MWVEAWVTFLWHGLGDKAILGHPYGSLHSWQPAVAGFHSVTGQLEMVVGITVDVV
jgi:hypothetical protein